MYQLDVARLIENFGGEVALKNGLKEVGIAVELGTVYAWKSRKNIGKSEVLLGMMALADHRGMRFDLRKYIIKPKGVKYVPNKYQNDRRAL